MKWNGMEWNGGRERWWVGCAVADVESKLVKVALDLTHEMLIGLGLTTHALQHLCVKSLGYGMQSRNPLDGEETVLLVAGTTTLEPFCQLIPSSSSCWLIWRLHLAPSLSYGLLLFCSRSAYVKGGKTSKHLQVLVCLID